MKLGKAKYLTLEMYLIREKELKGIFRDAEVLALPDPEEGIHFAGGITRGYSQMGLPEKL